MKTERYGYYGMGDAKSKDWFVYDRKLGVVESQYGKFRTKKGAINKADELNKNDGNKEIEILLHNISYYYDNGQDMPEHEQDHVKEMINQGYVEGELNDSNDTEDNYGWWRILK